MARNTTRLSLLLLVLLGCVGPKEKIPDTLPMKSSSRKVVIYQMMTRLFGNQKTMNKTFGTPEENGIGKFNDIDQAALKGIKELGVNYVWYTGILEHASLNDYTRFGIPLDDADVVQGRAGSPYAIKDYYDIDPDLAQDVPSRMKEFEELVGRTHEQGMKVIIDFVANHVARAYKSDGKPAGTKDLGEGDDKSASFSPKNNFYYLPGQSFQSPKDYVPLGTDSFPTKDGKFDETPAKVTGNGQLTASPGIGDWFDTIKLNYGVDIQHDSKINFEPIPGTWEKMRDILLFWTGKKVDGFRCDMAEMVPVEFWHWVIPQLKAINPDLIFVAEIYNPSQYRNYLETGGFDFLYDKVQLYDTLRRLIHQQASVTDIPKIQGSLSGMNQHMVHFLENHDEQRIASPFFAGDPWKAVPAMVISATIDRGPIMIYFGQEVGEPGAGVKGYGREDGRTTIYDYWGVPEHQKWVNGGKYDGGGLSDEQKQLRQFYGDILTYVNTSRAIAEGDYADLTEHNVHSKNTSDKIHTFVRVAGEERLVIVSGFNAQTEHVKIQLSKEAIDKLALKPDQDYIGHDMLRSSTDVGLDKSFTFELDVPPFSSFIFKIK